MKNGAATVENRQFLTQLSFESPYDSDIPLLGIYPRENKQYVHEETCTQMFTAELRIIAKRCRQPKCSPTNEWVNKLCAVVPRCSQGVGSRIPTNTKIRGCSSLYYKT